MPFSDTAVGAAGKAVFLLAAFPQIAAADKGGEATLGETPLLALASPLAAELFPEAAVGALGVALLPAPSSVADESSNEDAEDILCNDFADPVLLPGMEDSEGDAESNFDEDIAPPAFTLAAAAPDEGAEDTPGEDIAALGSPLGAVASDKDVMDPMRAPVCPAPSFPLVAVA